jgi:hypothetical protein
LLLAAQLREGEEEKAPEPLREIAISALDRVGNESAKARLSVVGLVPRGVD